MNGFDAIHSQNWSENLVLYWLASDKSVNEIADEFLKGLAKHITDNLRKRVKKLLDNKPANEEDVRIDIFDNLICLDVYVWSRNKLTEADARIAVFLRYDDWRESEVRLSSDVSIRKAALMVIDTIDVYDLRAYIKSHLFDWTYPKSNFSSCDIQPKQ
jgi:predicted DNA-binding protein YlxM (UPF0122 family)